MTEFWYIFDSVLSKASDTIWMLNTTHITLLHEQVMTHKSIWINYGSIYGIFHDSIRKEDVI
jgi:hypothetical protein